MNDGTAWDLRTRIEADPDVDQASLRTTTDVALGIGSDVWRLRRGGQLTTAVAADADLHTTCGALLDALALVEFALEAESVVGADPALDLLTVNVLVDRSLPGDRPSETDQALRSMRDAVQEPEVHLWYARPGEGWEEDTGSAPTWPEDDATVSRWRDDLLLPRLAAQPSSLVLGLLEAVDDPSLHLYPSEIKAGSTDVWALRIDGLQIGMASAQAATLTVGKPGKAGDGAQRTVFIEVFGQPVVSVSAARSATGPAEHR